MKISTRFNLGDKVYPITQGTKTVHHPCQACGGKGRVILGGKDFNCPECYGFGTTSTTEPQQWRLYPENVGYIGRVGVEIYATKYKRNGNKDLIRYMLSSTGVGSGSLWDEDKLFLTEEEALAECEKRNRKDY